MGFFEDIDVSHPNKHINRYAVRRNLVHPLEKSLPVQRSTVPVKETHFIAGGYRDLCAIIFPVINVGFVFGPRYIFSREYLPSKIRLNFISRSLPAIKCIESEGIGGAGRWLIGIMGHGDIGPQATLGGNSHKFPLKNIDNALGESDEDQRNGKPDSGAMPIVRILVISSALILAGISLACASVIRIRRPVIRECGYATGLVLLGIGLIWWL
jgi:hypothetical protein